MEDEKIVETSEPVAELSLTEKRRNNMAKARAARGKNKVEPSLLRAGAVSAAQIPDNAIASMSVQVNGAKLTIKDSKAHVWTIPADDNTDYRKHNSPYEMTRFHSENPLFEAQFINRDEVTTYFTNGWVPIERDELHLEKLPAGISKQIGDSVDCYHWVEGQLAIKRPKVLNDRQRKGFDGFRKEIANSMKPATQDGAAKQRLEAGGLVSEELHSQTTPEQPR